MGFSNAIAFFMIIDDRRDAHAAGITESRPRRRLPRRCGRRRPVPFVLFALGIIGTGMLALPVLAGSAA